MLRISVPLIFLVCSIWSCGITRSTSEVEFTGVIAKPGITSWQYGTHIITNAEERYALRSDNVDLDDYLGEKVTIYADVIEGYPIEGGPSFLVVQRVESYP